jgi:hypothetical protein
VSRDDDDEMLLYRFAGERLPALVGPFLHIAGTSPGRTVRRHGGRRRRRKAAGWRVGEGETSVGRRRGYKSRLDFLESDFSLPLLSFDHPPRCWP